MYSTTLEVEVLQPWKWSMLYWSLMINFFCFYLNRMSVICKCHRCGICCNWFLWFCLISFSPSLCYHTVFCKCLASLCCRIIYIQRKCLFIILTAVYNIIMYNVFFSFCLLFIVLCIKVDNCLWIHSFLPCLAK